MTDPQSRSPWANEQSVGDLAHSIGVNLAARACWQGERCHWVPRSRATSPGRDESAHAQPAVRPPATLYHGSTGIALFLAELRQVTNDPSFDYVIRGAIADAALWATHHDPADIGFFTGRLGVAYMLARSALALRDEELTQRAAQLAGPLLTGPITDQSYDVIGGAAGAIPAMLILATLLEDERWVARATELGHHLLREAQYAAQGWWWRTGRLVAAQRAGMLGMAHGCAGIAHGLLELYAATGHLAFRYGAEQAFAYEDARFRPADGNWPDVRHHDLYARLRTARGAAALRQQLQAGEQLALGTEQCATLWCHGAPGITLARLSAAAILRDARHAAWAEVGVRATLATIHRQSNVSLCHGLAGNCETLLSAAGALHVSQWADVARDALREQLTTWASQMAYWPGGGEDLAPQDSIMLGDAGLGYTLLRLQDPSVPSLLCLSAQAGESLGTITPTGTAEAVRGEYIESYFGQSCAAVALLTGSTVHEREPAGSREVPELDAIHTSIQSVVEQERDSLRQSLLRDATKVERARYLRACRADDFALELLEGLGRTPLAQIDWSTTRFQTYSRLDVVHTTLDWEQILETKTLPTGPHATQDRIGYAILQWCAFHPSRSRISVQSDHRFRSMAISRFA